MPEEQTGGTVAGEMSSTVSSEVRAFWRRGADPIGFRRPL